MRENTEDYEMLARLHFDSPKFAEWLKRRLATADDTARKARESVDVRWAQGRAQELLDIIEALEGAREVLRKADTRASRQEKR